MEAIDEIEQLNSLDLAHTEPQSKMKESVKEKKVQRDTTSSFKRQAVELVIHSGNTQGADRPGTGGQ